MLYYNKAIFNPRPINYRSHRSRRSPRSFTAAMTLFASAASEMIVSAMVMRWLKSATPVFRATDGDREKGDRSVAWKNLREK